MQVFVWASNKLRVEGMKKSPNRVRYQTVNILSKTCDDMYIDMRRKIQQMIENAVVRPDLQNTDQVNNMHSG